MWNKLPTLVWLAGAAFTAGALAASPDLSPAADPAGSAGAARPSPTAAPAPSPSADGTAAASPTPTPTAAEPDTVLRRRETDLGTVVVDGAGRTLYLSTADDNRPPTTTCYGACARRWPPVLTEGRIAVRGVDPDLVGTVRRRDGTYQVTLNGWPLYRYLRDRGPGDTGGEGYRNSWSAIGPNGKPAAG
jgi:predicted lipoprotein with Yx(FWY)xxD motif